MIKKYDGLRTKCQNCVEVLLGKEKFHDELEKGAFFLMEDWVEKWDQITKSLFGNKPELLPIIFQSEQKFFLALQTQCSSEKFIEKARFISKKIKLPIEQQYIDLDNLEKVLLNTFINKGIIINSE